MSGLSWIHAVLFVGLIGCGDKPQAISKRTEIIKPQGTSADQVKTIEENGQIIVVENAEQLIQVNDPDDDPKVEQVAVTKTPDQPESVVVIDDPNNPENVLEGGDDEIIMEFEVNRDVTRELSFNLNGDTFAQKITQEIIRTPDTLVKRQIERQLKVVNHEQGILGDQRADTFQQVAGSSGLIDILVVIDNSGSMAEEQANLATKLNPLLTYIADADWRIGVVTTDGKDGCMRAVINKGDADAASAFAEAINAGTNGSGYEEGFLAARQGLLCETPKWIRPAAPLAVLFVSDEDNHYREYDMNETLAVVKDTLGKKLKTEARFYGIIWIPGTTCKTGWQEGAAYKDIIDLTGGVAGSICATDYTSTLSAISFDVSTILNNQVELSADPDQNTITIKVNNATWNHPYTLNGRTITFAQEHLPPAGSTIKIEYTTPSTPVHTRFPLGEQPAAGTIAVKVNGTIVPPSKYTIDAGKNEIVFNSAPAEGAKIVVGFRKNTPLLTSWNIGQKAEDITIQIGGAPITEFTYDSGSGNITLSQPPIDSAALEIKFNRNQGPKAEYEILTEGFGQDGHCHDEESTAVPCTIAANKVTFTSDQVIPSRQITIVLPNPNKSSATLVLDEMPVAGTVKLTANHIGCLLDVDGKNLSITCEPGRDDVKVTYTPTLGDETLKLENLTKTTGMVCRASVGDQTLDFNNIQADKTITIGSEFLEIGKKHTVKVTCRGQLES